MADSFTPTLNLTKPEINQSINTWGNKLNGDLDLLDQFALETNADVADLQDRVEVLEAVAVPAGLIAMWSGAENAVPAGWALCNGSNGTPNLRDKFIVAAGPNRGVGTTGGADSQTVGTSAAGAHSHGGATVGTAINEAQMPPHAHGGSTDVQGQHQHTVGNIGVLNVSFWAPSPGPFIGPGTVATDPAGNHAHNITTDTRGGGQPHGHNINVDGNHAHSVTVPTTPAYFALAFIMKIPA